MRHLFLFLICCFPLFAEESFHLVLFTPPTDWQTVDTANLPQSVKYMVVGKGSTQFPPSINLGTDRHLGTLNEYLKIVKNINESQGTEWKDLGPIKTEAGTASLSQIDAKTEWGEVRMMHVIYQENETVYILTAAALKEEFPKFYQDFFKSMRSLRFCTDPLEVLEKKEDAELALRKLKEGIQTLTKNGRTSTQAFESKEFQNLYWLPFVEHFSKEYKDLGSDWQKALLTKAKGELISPKSAVPAEAS